MNDVKKGWVREDWLINYNDGIIKYNDMFRHKLLGYDEIVDIIHGVLKKYHADSLLDLGCGTGTFLEKLYLAGNYKCVGMDRNEESILVAKKKMEDKNLPIEFTVGDALSFEYPSEFDAIMEMFVPFSRISQLKVIKEAYKHLKQNGLLFFMVCEEIPGSKDCDSKFIMSYAETEETKCVRLEPWDKENNYLQWNPILLIEEDGRFKYYTDHDELEIFNKEALAAFIEDVEDVGYKIIEKYELPVRDSSPPWTTETIFVAMKK